MELCAYSVPWNVRTGKQNSEEMRSKRMRTISAVTLGQLLENEKRQQEDK